MSSDHAILAGFLREMFDDDPWHGASFHDTVYDLTPQQAAAKPIPGAHSIWETVLHVTTWMWVVRSRLQGVDDPVSPEKDWPRVPSVTAEAWEQTLRELCEAEARLRELLIRDGSGRFDASLPTYDRRMHRNAHGTISHLAWHGGQITMLRRAQGIRVLAEPRPQTGGQASS